MIAAIRKYRKGDRGIALITALLMTAVFLILIGSLMTSLVNELAVTGTAGQSNSALRAAYAGIEQMVYQFEENDAGAAPGVVPGTSNFSYPADENGNVVSYTVSVDAQRWTSILPYYILHATGTSGGSSRHVDALIQKMPFSAFSFFTISEQNNHGGAVFYASGEHFGGPVYSGGPMRIFYDDTYAGGPIFSNTVTTAQNPIWVPHAPGSPTDWNEVISNQSNFVQVTQPMTLPTATDNSAVKNAAFTGNPAPASPPTFPVAPGLYINGASVVGGGGALNTGIYIVGFTIVSSAATGSANTFTFQIFNGFSFITYHVIVDTTANTTTVTDINNTTIATYTGTPIGQQPPGVSGANGAIWGTSNLEFTAGNVYHGSYTFAVPDAQGLGNPSMFVFGSQTYQNPAKDELAFWANDIVLDDAVNGNIEIDGLMLTGYYGECSVTCNDGTFYNTFCPAVGACGGGTGTLTLDGSLIENVRGKRGTLGSTISGFSTNDVFDPRLARNPPPFTPTTVAYNVIALCSTDFGNTCGQ